MGAQLARCRSCGANIYWVKTESGKSMPVDAMPVPDGNIIFIDERAHVLKKDHEPIEEGQNRYVSHFVTCKYADKHRRIVARLKQRRN